MSPVTNEQEARSAMADEEHTPRPAAPRAPRTKAKKRLPKPPVPADADLRSYDRMPLDIVALQKSTTWSSCSGDEIRAALSLWMHAWHQVPAGSLPNDDLTLSRYAGMGQTDWSVGKCKIMANFELCNDGKLYHKKLCLVVNEVLKSASRYSEAGKIGAKSRWGNKKSGNSKTHGIAIEKHPQNHGIAIEKHPKKHGIAIPNKRNQVESVLSNIEDDIPAGARAHARDRDLNNVPTGLDEQPVGEESKLRKQAFATLDTVLEICNCQASCTAGILDGPLDWLKAGAVPEIDVYPGIRSIAEKPDFDPPRSSLRCFTAMVKRAIARRATHHDAQIDRDARHRPLTPENGPSDRAWRIVMQGYVSRADWGDPSDFGPRPDQGTPGWPCAVPEHVLNEFGMHRHPDNPSLAVLNPQDQPKTSQGGLPEDDDPGDPAP